MDSPSRRLIWVPVVHGEADLGSLRDCVRAAHGTGWDAHTRCVADFWRAVRVKVENLRYAPSKTRLYQDGLPECGREAEIVRDLAAAGSPNHRLLLDLMNRGATLTGTEDPRLLLEEYELQKGLLDASTDTESLRQKATELLEARDQHIARRIAATLAPDEIGLLFLGLLHQVDAHLPADIAVTRLT